MRISRWLVPFAIPCAFAVTTLGAQSVEAISFGAGVASDGMWEENVAAVFNFRVEMPWSPAFMLEPGLVFARGNLDGEGGATLLVPELQAQARLPLGGA